MRLFLPILVFLASCGSEAAYTSYHGFRVYGESAYKQADVDMAVSAVLQEAAKVDAVYKNADAKNRFRGASIEFVSEPFDCVIFGSGEIVSKCAGMHYVSLKEIKVYVPPTCIIDSALVHELIHFVVWEVKRVRVGHGELIWYGSDSVEAKANHSLKKLCRVV